MKELLRWSSVLRRRYGERVQKISLDIGAGCPHRNGLRVGGCLFCNEQGGGSGAYLSGLSIHDQVVKGVAGAWKHYRARSVILYFQSYSATNLPLPVFQSALEEALDQSQKLGVRVIGLAVGTRPDLAPDPVLDYLESLCGSLEVWLELGVQTLDPDGLRWLNRGHGVEAVEDIFSRLRNRSLLSCAHLIGGIPGEKPDQLKRSALWLAERGVRALKFHPLHVLRGSALEKLYLRGEFVPIDRETYLERLLDALLALPDGIVLQRLTAGVRPVALAAPQWVLEKESLEREIESRFRSAAARISQSLK